MRVEHGALHRVHQGVFAVGHPVLSHTGRFMAATLACGPSAVLSHRSAAIHWGLRAGLGTPIDVTAPGRRGRAPEGITAHRDDCLTPADRTEREGIPCTAVARTLLDLAGASPLFELRKAVAQAEVLRLLDLNATGELIRRSRGRRGVARLRLVIDELHPATRLTRSELERRFLELCRRHGLPVPEVNKRIEVGDQMLRPDFLWRDARLVVEADGREFHDTASAFEADRRRDQDFQLAGWTVTRCTWGQVLREPRRLAVTIRALLAPSQPPMGRKGHPE
jgi:very-short-patch-repair endonuclease